MPRRMKKLKVDYISLVPKGANKMPTVWKDDERFEVQMLTKEGEDFLERGELLAVVYAPNIVDSQGDFADAETIKEAMYDAARRGVEIDVRHDENALHRDQAFIAENFIIQKGDPRFDGFTDYDGEPVDVTGGWGVVLKIEDESLREKYRKGEWNGVSLGGSAIREAAKDDATGVLKQLLGLFTGMFKQTEPSTNGDIDMKPEEMKQLLKEFGQELASSITKALKGEEKPEPKTAEDKDKADDSLVFKGEPTIENLRKHRDKVARKAITDAIDWSDPESIAEGERKLAEIDAMSKSTDGLSNEEVAAGCTKADSEEVRELKVKLFKAQRKSNQTGEGDGNRTNKGEDEDGFEAGAKVAQAINKSRGLGD